MFCFQSLRMHLDFSLKALNTEYVWPMPNSNQCLDLPIQPSFSQLDIFYLHAPDREVSIEVTLEAVNELFKSGKFKRFGISNYQA